MRHPGRLRRPELPPGPRDEWLDRTRKPKPTDRTLNVGVMQQAIHTGGAEIWAETCCRYSRHYWSFWSDRSRVEPGAIEELGAAKIHSENWNEWRDAQDVIIVWCHLAEMVMARLKGWGGELIALSQGSGQWTANFMHSLTPYADRLFAVSEYSARLTFKPEDVDRVNVILNSADPARIVPTMPRAESRAALNLSDQLAVAYIGRWGHEKNPAASARAVAVMDDAIAVYKCPAYDLAKRELRHVLPAGRRRFSTLSVADTLAASDVLVLASPGEGCALIVMEALAAGVPVVATPVGGIEEMERDHGHLVIRVPIDPHPKVLAEAIREAHAKREQLMAAGIAFTSKWNVRTMAAKWDELLTV